MKMQWNLFLLILTGQCFFVMCVDHEDQIILIKEKKTWEEALDYCRENHHDLVSITNQTQQTWVEGKVGTTMTESTGDAGTDTGSIWLGLRYTCTLGIWFWVNGEVLNYDNFTSTPSPDCNSAAAMQKVDPYKWVKNPDDQKFYFICVE
ncbi:snaclec coagulation factor IX/factor X-binding protein subunit B-like [Limanda limanda]|uniref:snaclec coagulation factor IX/factor X-binding protein subunit B-like n=1 Tax=Limanda limanda TaxID=27771 RepID=UPI0029C7E0FB|nr:snaclec coagulation factor IX/factor X-binding protein subunit B-like [Limanda limanda]XP_060922376.1 snaclec coagulation factor IX/factor X-binding protein subunit B-like [Limanda limanda]